MVHRAADSRLLSNLLQQEKEYSKQLNQVLDSSNASLASFAAYAAASPPPASHVIMAVTTSLAAADDSLRRYARGVEEWRESMRILKDAEEEVGNIMRDREILVTRMIKASKSHKSSSNFRDSLLLGHQRFPSSSSLSLSFNATQDSPSPPPSRPLSGAFSSTKLAAAQTELQACEAHLAAKERELDLKRCAAVRDGMGARVKAMMECGWAWNQHGKEALRALEDLKVETSESYIPDTHPHDVFQGLKIPEPDSTRPSSDFSSIGPSQSASQVNVDPEHVPPAVHMGSIMNSGLFGDPPPRLDANDQSNPNDDAVLHVHDPSSFRPGSGASTTTSSVSAIPATYKVEHMTYAQAVALHVSGRDVSAPPPVPSSPSHLLTSSELFKDEDVHKSVRIPAPHALEGYAFDIPTAEMHVAGPSGLQNMRSRSNDTPPVSGRSTPQPSGPPPVSYSSSPYTNRRVLERRITEEELKQSMEETRSVSSTEEDVKTEKKLVQEGKLAVVENPRFMTEARKKELEKEEERERRTRAKAKAKAKQQVVAGDVTDEVETPKKEKKRFSFFHSPAHTQQHSRLASTSVLASTDPQQHQQGDGHVTFDTANTRDAEERLTKSPGSSPGKGFFGSLKGFFVSKHSGQTAHPPSSPSSPSKSRNRRPMAVGGAGVDSSDDEEENSPTARTSGGLQNLFRGSSSSSRDKDQNRERALPKRNKWETRTDKNIRQLTKRASLDEGSLRRPGGPVGVGNVGLGIGSGLAGKAVMNAGVVSASEVGVGHEIRGVPPRGRAVSDVGVGGSASMSVGAGVAGRRLKKNRGGPPVSQSALGTVGGVGVARGAEKRTVGSSESLPTDVGHASRVPAQARLPMRAASTSIPAREKGKVPVGTGTGIGTSRRSASVDVGTRRRTWVDDGEEEGSSSGGGMIVDLGKRRQTSSDVGGVSRSGGGGGQGRTVVASSATRESRVKVQQEVSKPLRMGYSSDTAAVVSASAAPVSRKKSLTKKKAAAPADHATPPPPPIPLSGSTSTLPVRKPSVKSSTSAQSTNAKMASSSSAVGVGVGTGAAATFISANNENPSGTLVAQPGWNAHVLGGAGGLSRNLSVTSTASAPIGGGPSVGRGKKQTSLGQGVGAGLGRRSSVGSGAASTAVPSGKSDGRVGRLSSVATTASAGGKGTVVQPAPPAASLMSIVEDVARSNREGWSPDLRKSAGGSQRAVGMIEVVKAPPRVPREALQAMDIGTKSRAGPVGGDTTSTSTSTSKMPTTTMITPQKTPLMSGMFEVKAPGSVFDQKPQMGMDRSMEMGSSAFGGMSAPRPVQTSTPKKEQAQAQAHARTAALSNLEFGSLAGQAKIPLRSAMRNPSPGPSRPTATQRLPPPIKGPLPRDEGTRRSQDKGKGKAVDVDDGGTTTDSESYETGNEYYSGEEEHVEKSPVVASPQAATKTTPIANGHVVGYETPKKASSDASHSTTSTLMVGPTGSGSKNLITTPTTTPVQRHPSLVTHTAPGSQTPRRRKSVRVSLQPTFSPSPPAMDYDYEEEQARYAPWNGMEVPRARAVESKSQSQSETYSQQPAPPASVVPARAPASATTTLQHKVDVDTNDMWQDSGSDEDEEYTRAKRLLTRAAKREKDISILVANRA